MKTLLASSLAVGLAALPAASLAQSYTITDLGALLGTQQGNDTVSVPYGLNNHGQAVGLSSSPSAAIATLFANGSAKSLGFIDGQAGDDVSLGTGINDSGVTTGAALAGDGLAFHAFVDNNGKMTDINSASTFLGGSRAYSINSSGQVVGLGYLDSSDDSFHAFLYTGGKMVDIGPPGSYQASASAINDSGEVIGSFYGTTIGTGAFVYSGGKSSTLPVPSGASAVAAFGINVKGQIVGSIYPNSGPSHAALYNAGAWTDLGAVSGATATEATGINSSGQIVGMTIFPDTGNYHHRIPGKRVAFIYLGGTLVDLGTLVPSGSGFTVGGNSKEGSVSINNSGQILCTALNAAGNNHAVLLTPIKAP